MSNENHHPRFEAFMRKNMLVYRVLWTLNRKQESHSLEAKWKLIKHHICINVGICGVTQPQELRTTPVAFLQNDHSACSGSKQERLWAPHISFQVQLL